MPFSSSKATALRQVPQVPVQMRSIMGIEPFMAAESLRSLGSQDFERFQNRLVGGELGRGRGRLLFRQGDGQVEGSLGAGVQVRRVLVELSRLDEQLGEGGVFGVLEGDLFKLDLGIFLAVPL